MNRLELLKPNLENVFAETDERHYGGEDMITAIALKELEKIKESKGNLFLDLRVLISLLWCLP